MSGKQIPRNTLSDDEFGKIATYRGVCADLSVRVDITNFLKDEISVVDCEGTTRVIKGEFKPDLGHCLILVLTVEYRESKVNIDANKDYSEAFCFNVYASLRGYCRWRLIDEPGTLGRRTRHCATFLITKREMRALGGRIEIPEIGLLVQTGYVDPEERFDRLDPGVHATDGGGLSGNILTVTDKEHRYENLFYCIGNVVHRAKIARRGKGQDGIEYKLYNYVNEDGRGVPENYNFFTLEEGLSGENPLGIKFFTSENEARNVINEKKPTAKTKDVTPETKEKDLLDEKEKKAKVTQAWIKAAGDFIKSVLPTVLKGVKWVMALLVKAPIPI